MTKLSWITPSGHWLSTKIPLRARDQTATVWYEEDNSCKIYLYKERKMEEERDNREEENCGRDETHQQNRAHTKAHAGQGQGNNR